MPRPTAKNSPLLNRVALAAAVAVLVVAGLYLIVTSPALSADASGDISAILSGLALCGVAGSLALQRRQAAIEQLAAERQRHFDIVSLSLNDPELLAAILPDTAGLPNVRQEVYINLMVGYWMTTWQLGGMSESNLRYNVARLFKGRVGWEWWRRIRLSWADTSSASQRRFTRIIDDEWRRATEPSPPPNKSTTPS